MYLFNLTVGMKCQFRFKYEISRVNASCGRFVNAYNWTYVLNLMIEYQKW